MKKIRVLAIFLILLCSMPAAFASLAIRPSVSVWAGGVFCHPTASYLKEYPGNPEVEMPDFRTSYSLGFDFRFLALSQLLDESLRNSINVDAGISYISVSESIPFGISILKPYKGIGFVAGLGYSFNDTWSLRAGYTFMSCHFTESDSRFVAHEVELSPSFRFVSVDIFNFMVSLPVSALIKADSVSIRASIELTIQVDSSKLRRSSR